MNALQVAQVFAQMKIREHGANRGEVIDWMARELHTGVGEAWCAKAVSMEFLLAERISKGSGETIIKTASSQAFKTWGVKHKRFFTNPQQLENCRGAIAGWTNTPDTAQGHVFLVGGRLSAPGGQITSIETYEGNSDISGDANGDGFYFRRRSVPKDGGHEIWFVDTTGLVGGDWWS